MAAKLDKEYQPIDGAPSFREACARFLLGDDSRARAKGSVATCQTLGGTGALRMAAEFYKKWAPKETSTPVYADEAQAPLHPHASPRTRSTPPLSLGPPPPPPYS